LKIWERTHSECRRTDGSTVSEALLERDQCVALLLACGFARGRDALDAGCGAGYSSAMFPGSGACSYLGIDINADAVELATKN
jgi:predicted RNA methylase